MLLRVRLARLAIDRRQECRCTVTFESFSFGGGSLFLRPQGAQGWMYGLMEYRIIEPTKGKADMSDRSATVSVVRCDSVPLGLSVGAKLPERIKVLGWGENPNVNGLRVHVGESLVNSMASPMYPWPVVALDFQHNTVPGHKVYLETSEPRKVAGFGRIEVVKGDGVFLTMNRWTPEGLSNALNFDDVSAAPVRNKDGDVIGIHSVGLCRNGAVPGMDFVEVALSVDSAVFAALSVNTKEEISMDFKGLIITALGLSPDIGDEELQKALIAALKPVEKKEPAPGPDALNVELGKKFDQKLADAVTPLTKKVDALSVDNDGLKKELLKRDKQVLVDSAGREGKVCALSVDVLAGMTVDQVKEHCAALSVTVPLDGRNGGANPDSGKKGPSAQQRKVAASLGIDADTTYGKGD